MSIIINTSAVLLLIVGITCRAEPQEIASSLMLEQIIPTALAENAQLHSMRAKWEAMQERSTQERTPPNPMFKYSGMDMAGGNWPNTSEKRVMIEQEMPWFGKLDLRGKVATKEAEAMQREYEAMIQEVTMMVKENYYDLYAVQHSIVITRTDETVLNRMVQTTISKYSVGEVAQPDVLKAQAEVSMLKARLYEFEQQEVLLKAKLNQLLNRHADAPMGLAVTPPQREIQFKMEELFELAEKMRPEIKKTQAGIQRDQYAHDLMKKEFFPDYRLGLEYRNVGVDFSNFNRADNMLMLTIGFDLPIWRKKYKAGVHEAEKMIESSQAALETVQKQTSYDVQDAYFKLQTAQRTLDLYKSALIPQAEARFQASEAAYRTGSGGFLDLLESQRFLLNARIMATTAEGNVGMQLGRLERAVGMDLKPDTILRGERK